MNGKGDRRCPLLVPRSKFFKEWDKTMGRRKPPAECPVCKIRHSPQCSSTKKK